MVMPSAFIAALIYFTQFFIILIPSHRCSIDSIDYHNSNNESTLDLKNYIPFDIKNGKTIYNNCYSFENPNLNLDKSSESLLNKTLQKCSNGWHYDYSSIYPTIATELNWVCDHNLLPYVVQNGLLYWNQYWLSSIWIHIRQVTN